MTRIPTENEAVVLSILYSHGPLQSLEVVNLAEGQISHGSIYFLLSQLKKRKLVHSRPDRRSNGLGRPKNIFELTDLGKKTADLVTKLIGLVQ